MPKQTSVVCLVPWYHMQPLGYKHMLIIVVLFKSKKTAIFSLTFSQTHSQRMSISAVTLVSRATDMQKTTLIDIRLSTATEILCRVIRSTSF